MKLFWDNSADKKMFEVLNFYYVKCTFDYHNAGKIVNAVDKHSPESWPYSYGQLGASFS